MRSYVTYLRAVFGNSKRAGRVGRVEIYSAKKVQDDPCQAPIDNRMTFELRDLPGSPYRVETRAGVFSWDGLDDGTRLLIDCMDVRPTDQVHPLIEGAFRALRPGGRLMLVVMRPEAYLKHIRKVFGQGRDRGAKRWVCRS